MKKKPMWLLGSRPVKPKWLTGKAGAFWDRVVPGLKNVVRTDWPYLVAMCRWWAFYLVCFGELSRRGHQVTLETQLQLHSLANDAFRNFMKKAARFGLIPKEVELYDPDSAV